MVQRQITVKHTVHFSWNIVVHYSLTINVNKINDFIRNAQGTHFKKYKLVSNCRIGAVGSVLTCNFIASALHLLQLRVWKN